MYLIKLFRLSEINDVFHVILAWSFESFKFFFKGINLFIHIADILLIYRYHTTPIRLTHVAMADDSEADIREGNGTKVWVRFERFP